jgi:hypothetical protein
LSYVFVTKKIVHARENAFFYKEFQHLSYVFVTKKIVQRSWKGLCRSTEVMERIAQWKALCRGHQRIAHGEE